MKNNLRSSIFLFVVFFFIANTLKAQLLKSPEQIVNLSADENFESNPYELKLLDIPADKAFILTDIYIEFGNYDVYSVKGESDKNCVLRLPDDGKFSTSTGVVFGPGTSMVLKKDNGQKIMSIKYNLIGYYVQK